MSDPKLTDKIRKLLALAADPNAAPNEAETAGRMAARLMAKHDIDLADLEEEALRQAWDMTELRAQGCRPGKKNAVEVPPWIGIIAWGVKVYTRTRTTTGAGYIKFKGPREDVELAKWLHEYLLHQAYEASKGLPLGEANRFRNGFASALQGRLKRMARDRDASDREDHTGTSGTALIKVQDARSAEMDRLYGPETRGKTTGVKASADGREAGMNAAIPTNRPIASAGRRMLGLS